MLRFVKITENASTPTKGSPLSAGYDLYSSEDVDIPARDKAAIATDLKISVPVGTYGRIAPRSGLALRDFIDIGGGVIDEDYTGHVKIIIFNHDNKAFKIQKGDRIAQLICERILHPTLKEVQTFKLTKRSENSFGSTGK